MLPRIDAQQWRELAHHGVLVGVRPDENLPSLVVLDEPRPSAPLDPRQRGVELGLEGPEVAVRCFDCGLLENSISNLNT